MAELLLCCGKIASGKTHFCNKLQKNKNYFVFNTDEWMIHFYGESPDCSLFHKRLEICSNLIFKIASELLDKGLNVVLDFGFWKESDRKACFDYFSEKNPQIKKIILYFPIDFEKQKKYLSKREKDFPQGSFHFTEEKLIFFNEKFEEPQEKELIIWNKYKINKK